MRDALIGTRINRYEIREAIHKSDVIGIYKAYDTKLERFVLIKTIIHSSEYSKEAVEFFLAESRGLAKLAHPNIAKVLDFGYENGNLYLVSEFVPGVPLSDLMNNPMPWQNAVNILLPLTNALIYAHSRGIIHRDLKPDNIVINTDDQPILSDFSLMRIIEEEETRDMTGTNVGLGSPEYISPEQGQGMTVDFRSDIYSLGVIFFELVTGKKLFYAANSMEIVIQHIMADPPKPRSIIPTLPRMVEAVILNALSKDREKRYQTMDDFSNAIKAIIEADNRAKNKTSRRPSRLSIFSAVGIAALLVVVGLAIRNQTITTTSLTLTATYAQISQTETPRSTPTPKPDSTTSALSTPTKPIVESDDPFVDYQLPELPVLAGTKLPSVKESLAANNIFSIRELARWEQPEIRQLALINNDQVILAGTSAGMYFYDPQTLTARAFFDTQGAISIFTISDDGAWVATADQNGTIAIWNIANGERLHQLEDKDYKAKIILSIDFSPDKSKLVFSDNAKNIHFWDIEANQYSTFENRLTANANKALFLDDGETVISGGDNFQIITWDARNRTLKTQTPASQKINDMALSPDNRYLALALDEAIIEIWDLVSGEKRILKDPNILKPFTSITFLPNGTNFLTGSADGFVRYWSITSSAPLWEVISASQANQPNVENAVRSLLTTKDGTTFIARFADGQVEIWNMINQRREKFNALGSTSIQRAAISPDNQLLALQGANGQVKIMTLNDDSQSAKISGALPRGNPISPNNAMIGVVPIDRIDQLELYSLSASAPEKLFTLFYFPVFGSVNYSLDSNILAASSRNDFSYWSTSSGRELKESLPKRDGLCYKIHRPDNQFIAGASELGVIYTDANIASLFCKTKRDARAMSEEFLPDGSIIAIALQNQRVKILDLLEGAQKREREIKLQTPGDVLDVSISSDGKLLATASQGGTVEIYNLETLALIKTLYLLTGPVSQTLFTSDGNYLVVGSNDGALRIYGIHP